MSDSPWDNHSESLAEFERLDAELRGHPGKVAHQLLDEVVRGWDTFDGAGRNIYALMTAGETDENLVGDLIDWRGVKRAAYVKASDAALQAFVAALGALIDVTRRVVRKQPETIRSEYATRVAVVAKVEGAGLFKGLRNYVLHVGQVPWSLTATIKGGHASASITVISEELLRWDGWDVSTKRYLRSMPAVPLGPLVTRYRDALRELYVWLVDAIQDAHASDTAGANELVRRKNLVLTGGLYEDQGSFMAVVEKGVAEWRASQRAAEEPPRDPSSPGATPLVEP